MPRPRVLTDEERAERKREAFKRYTESEKGKAKMKDLNQKYQQTEKYKEYKHQYYLRKKQERLDAENK